MDLVTTFFASGIEVLIVYGIITILDKGNQIHTVGLALMVLGIAAEATVVDYLKLPYYFIFSSVTAIFLLKVLSKRSLYIVFVDLTITMCVITTTEFAVIVAFSHLYGNIEENNWILFSVLLFLCVTVWFIHRSLRFSGQIERYYTKNRDIIFWIAVNLLLALQVVTSLWNDAKPIFWSQAVPLLILMVLIYGLNIALMISFVRRKGEQSKLQVTKEYQVYLESMMYKLSQERHEYKNQINTIIGLAQTQKPEEAVDAILRYGEEILQKSQSKSAETVICSDTLVGAALYRKEQQAEEWQIRFEQMIETPFPHYDMSSYDLTELLANLLNNAFEAVKDLPEEDREVFLNMSAKKIEVLNALPAGFDQNKIPQFSEQGYSTKGKNRGYGMANIYRIMDKYQAKINIYITGNLIAFEVKF